MRDWPMNRVITLQQTGPPPIGGGVQAPNVSNRRSFAPETMAALRSIPSHPLNFKATLLGYEEAFDGVLQGDYIWQDRDKTADNGVTRIRPNDYRNDVGGVWWKLTST